MGNCIINFWIKTENIILWCIQTYDNIQKKKKIQLKCQRLEKRKEKSFVRKKNDQSFTILTVHVHAFIKK